MDNAAAAAFVAALRDRGWKRKSATKCELAEQQQQQQQQQQQLREGELARGQEGGGDLERKLALELKLQQTEETKVAEEQEQEMEQEKSRAGDLERLKALRALIQQDPRNVEALAEAGLVAVLVERIRSSPHAEQVFVLQIMAALGFMVQKSPGRIAEALEAGVIEAIVNRLLTPSSSEGVLLLAVQVLVFLVENEVALHHFLACNIQDALIVVLERGCVRSSLLNARVANLLSRVCELTPGTAQHVYVSLLQSISAATAAIENHTSHAKSHARVTSPENLTARLAQIDNRCITLCQGLGYLLDNQLITHTASQQVFEAGFIDIFVRLLSQHRIISSHLLETATWTIAYAIAGSTDRAALLGQHSRAQDLVLIVRRTHRLEDGAVHAYSSLMSSMIGALSTTDRVTALAVTARLMSCLMAVDVATADRSNLERSRDRAEVDRIILRAQHTTGNALRVVRRIAKLGGTALEILLEGGLFKGIVSLLARSQAYSECLRADLLQEIGLLVEHSPRLGLHMALAGALDELKVAVERSVTVQELCNATRALACFVEHNTPQGLRITDMALAKACDEVLVRILIERDARKTNYEVLLNTVGGLGYLNKRQSTHAGGDVPLSATSGASAQHADATMRKRYVEASTALVSLLRDSKASGDSLVWNSLWTLIYMMHGPFASACIKAVHQADGVALLSSIITTNGKNQPLVCSAAKALYEVVRTFPQGILDNMPLNVRLKVLACAARARPLSSTGEVDMSRTLEIAVDPENILESTMCKLETVHGDSLRASALKIQYVSGDVEQVGIDAGGVRRDWLSRLSRDLFNPNFGLVIAGFHPNDSVQLSPDPSFAGMSMEDQQRWYMLMGRVLGLSVLYGDPLGTALVPSWCKLLLEEEPDFNDIRYVSKQYFSTFSSLRELRETDPLAFAASLRDLTFTVNSRELMMKEAFERDTDTPPVSPMRSLKPKVASMLSSSKLLTAHSPPTSLESITTMSELHTAMQVARASQDRNQLRRLLLLQNTLLAKQKDLLTRPASDTKRARRLSAVSETSSVAMEDLGSPTLKRPRFRSASTDETRDLIKSPCHFEDAQDDEDKEFFRGVGHTDKEEENHLDEDQDDVDDDEEGASEDEKRMQRMMSTLYDGGDAEEINPGNFNRYLEMLTYKLLVENVAQQLALVKRGFHEIVPRKLALLLLRPNELQSLIEGDRDISIERWKANTIYKGNGNVDDADQIRWFWEYASDLAKEDRQKLLLWATGWRAIGQTGFAHRPFTVEVTSVESPAENERLPSVATCSFHLWIPKYSSKSQLVRKFNLALQEASFGNC